VACWLSESGRPEINWDSQAWVGWMRMRMGRLMPTRIGWSIRWGLGGRAVGRMRRRRGAGRGSMCRRSGLIMTLMGYNWE
jgi:hypothetical protein